MIKRASAMDLLCDDNGLGIEKYFKKDPEAFYINETVPLSLCALWKSISA